MTDEFIPNKTELKNTEFSVWEYRGDTPEDPVIEISEEEKFAAKCALLKEEARAAGHAQGLEEARVQVTEQKAELVRWIDLLLNPTQLLDDKVTQELIQTMIWLCKQAIGVELSIDSNQLKGLFEAIKKELPTLQTTKKFAMHPDDVAWVKMEFDESLIPGLLQVIVADPLLNRGDFYLVDDESELDGRLHTRLTTLFSKFIDKDTLIIPIKPQE